MNVFAYTPTYTHTRYLLHTLVHTRPHTHTPAYMPTHTQSLLHPHTLTHLLWRHVAASAAVLHEALFGVTDSSAQAQVGE